MEEIINSLSSWKKNGKGYPTQVQIHPTNYCNLKCIFCPTRALTKELDRKKELNREEWSRLIDEGNELSVREWHICGGGEPFFFTEDVLAIMRKIKESNRYGEVITNGTFFQEDVARTIVKMKWDKIYISLDSPIAETQNFLRGVNCFEKIIGGVKNLVELKKKLRKENPQIYFHLVICNKNYQQVPEMVKLAHKLKVQGISLNALNVWKPEINKLKLNKKESKEFKEVLQKSEKLANKLKISTNIQDFSKFLFVKRVNVMNKAMINEVKKSNDTFTSIACYYPWYNISIFADGSTLPCFILKDVGESVKEKSLKDIWFGNYFAKMRQTFLKNRLKEDCSRCNPWNLPKMNEIREKLKNLEI
jgi:MoaA/NifB/PqqE/SkfB family radical SAM enzyme